MPPMLLAMIVIMLGTSFWLLNWLNSIKEKLLSRIISATQSIRRASFIGSFDSATTKFYEGQLVDEELRLVYQGFMTQLRASQKQTEDFKEFIGCGFMKLKSTCDLTVSLYNQHHLPAEIKQALQQLEDYLEQVLYFTRAEMQKDYLIRQVPLQQIIRQ